MFSIPAGFLIDRFTEKPVMIAAFLAAVTGRVEFRASIPHTRLRWSSLFTIGAGMAMLQVAINPLLRVAGGEEHFAFNSALAQFVFGAASFLSPLIYSYMVNNLPQAAEPRAVSPDAGAHHAGAARMGVDLLDICGGLRRPWLCCSSPSASLTSKRPKKSRPARSAHTSSMLRRGMVWLYFGCMFAYVGSEQGTADWISKFLSQYHGYDPHTTGAGAVSWFWGLMTAGCFVGMILLKAFDSRRVLLGFAIGALATLSAALFGPATVSLYAFPLIGFFASIMWPTVISLALNSVSEHHGSFAGILCTGIVGGAVVPLVIGRVGDLVGLRAGMMFLYVTFGMRAERRPLVKAHHHQCDVRREIRRRLPCSKLLVASKQVSIIRLTNTRRTTLCSSFCCTGY